MADALPRFISIERLDDGRIVRLSLNRPEVRNAMNRGLLVELDEAFLACEADDDVRVIILRGEGKMFSSGHDLGSTQAMAERVPGPDMHPTFASHGATQQGAEPRMLQEWHFFFQNAKRWRDLRKITIAQVHGPIYAGALIVAWCCDLIVAAEDTVFADISGTRMGMCGTEYFAHPWELGPRRAKELLLTGDSIDAREAYRMGMVNKVFPLGELDERTLAFARRIAANLAMTALMIKESVNQTVDIQGFSNALNACFSIHQLNHSHWMQINEGALAIARPEHGIADPGQRPTVRVRQPREE